MHLGDTLNRLGNSLEQRLTIVRLWRGCPRNPQQHDFRERRLESVLQRRFDPRGFTALQPRRCIESIIDMHGERERRQSGENPSRNDQPLRTCRSQVHAIQELIVHLDYGRAVTGQYFDGVNASLQNRAMSWPTRTAFLLAHFGALALSAVLPAPRAIQNEDLAGGLADCNTALSIADKKNPNYGHLFENRGLLELRQANYDKAIADFDAALKTMPRNAYALYGRGVAKMRKNKTAEGEADIAEAVKIMPSIAGAIRGARPRSVEF